MDAAVAAVMERLDRYSPSGSSDPTVPILKAFMEHLPVEGKSNLIKDLQSFHSDARLKQHAESLRTCLLIPMKAQRQTPSLTMSPREGLDQSIENIAGTFDLPASRDARMKMECLECDNRRCTMSGRVEKTFVSKRDTTTPAARTECAHIIPFSLGKWDSRAEETAKAETWVTINRCFPNLSRDLKFTHESVNDNRNGITMQKECHPYFGQFEISFEATATPDTYRVMNHVPNVIPFSLPPQVRFVCHDGRYELPSPQLLQVHAAIARILHASGQAEEIDQVLRDQDATRVLAKDGSTDLSALLSATSLSAMSSARWDFHNVPRGR